MKNREPGYCRSFSSAVPKKWFSSFLFQSEDHFSPDPVNDPFKNSWNNPANNAGKDSINNTGNDLFYYTALVNYNNKLKNKDNQIKLLSQQIENKKCPKRGFNIPIGTNCSAQNVGRFTIDEKGKLYKCRDELREEYHFGDINTWDPANPILTAENPDMITCYLNSIYGLEDEECRECVWVPFCRGGCTKFRLFYNKKCLPYKNNPDYFVLGVAKYYLKNNLLTNNKK